MSTYLHKTIAIVSTLVMITLLSSCSTTLDRAINIALGAEISYKTNIVYVNSNTQAHAKYRLGQAVFLFSNVHDGPISSSVFAKGSRRGYVEAKLDMPKSVPAGAEDVCFYVTTQNQEIIPNVVFSEGKEGFKNTLWQTNVAAPFEIRTLEQANDIYTANLTESRNKLERSQNILEASASYENSACKVPAHSYQEPTAPFNKNFLANIADTSLSMCITARATEMSFISLLDVVSDKAQKSILELSNDRYKDSVAIVKEQSQQSIQGLNALKAAYDALIKPGNTKECTAFSECSIIDELSFGAPLSWYAKAFDSCLRETTSYIESNQRTYLKAHLAWEKEPQKIRQICRQNLQAIKSIPISINEFIENININQRRIDFLKGLTPETSKVAKYGVATPCSVQHKTI